MTDQSSPTLQPRGPAALLSKLVMVRPGELTAILWSAAYFFFVLSSYYLLRPLRETMGIERGADKLPWLMTGTLIAMFAANPAFTALVSRFPRRVFIPVTYRFFALNLLVFCALFRFLPNHGGTTLGYAFYIWLSVFNLFVVTVFWGFMADMFASEQGKRLFGAIAIGGTLGAIAGPYFSGRLSTGIDIPGTVYVVRLGTPGILLLSIIPLELSVQCVNRLVNIFGIGSPNTGAAPAGRARSLSPEPGRDVFAGLVLIARSPYLLLICLYMLVFTMASSFLYIEQGKVIEQAFTDRAARTRAFADIDLYANILTLVAQTLLTARIIRFLGLGGTLAILPTLTLVGFLVFWYSPTLGVLTVFQVVRRGVHYAVDRPAREVLFTGLGPDEKYKSKSFIDTFVYRAGDMAGGWIPIWLEKIGVVLGWVAIPVTVVGLLTGIILGVRHKSVVQARTDAPASRGV